METFDSSLPDLPDAIGGGDLEVLRLSETPTFVALFTDQIGLATTHFIDFPNLRTELHCNAALESRCLLCDIKSKSTKRAILPVYEISSAQIKAMLVSDNRNPNALAPQIKAELTGGDLDKRILAITRKSNKFAIQSVAVHEGNELGEVVIAGFIAKLKNGQISLGRVMPTISNHDLWDVPEIERSATILGLNRADYSTQQTKTQEIA
jgi:hypothetical protein